LFLGKKYYQKIKRYKKNIYIKDNLGKKTHVKPKKKNKKKTCKKKTKTKYKKNYNTSPIRFKNIT
jgi:hypothetical protein